MNGHLRLRLLLALAGAVLALSPSRPAHAEDFPAPAPQDTLTAEGTVQSHRPGEVLRDAHLPLGIHWDEGLWVIRKPKKLTLKINFRMDIDWVGVDDQRYVDAGGRVGKTSSGGQFRRARYTMRGDLGAHAYWKMSVEATDAGGGLRDCFVDFRRFHERGHELLPNIKFGNFFEPYSLEQTTPSSRLTFMSRSASTLGLGLGRSLGIMAYDSFKGEKFGYALGAFVSPLTSLEDFGTRIVDDTVVRDGYGITGRIWWMPWGGCHGPCRRLLLGFSASRRLGMSGIQFRARPESNKFDFVIDTDFSSDGMGTPLLDDADTAYLTATEFAWTGGPWSVQAEYYFSRIYSEKGGDPFFHGGYVLVSYWLTGECRRLARGSVQPLKICRPRDPCLEDPGWGGVELAARASTVDLDDARVNGGKMQTIALGLNWHLAERRRLMFNFVRAQVNDGIANEPIWIFQTRFQLEF